MGRGAVTRRPPAKRRAHRSVHGDSSRLRQHSSNSDGSPSDLKQAFEIRLNAGTLCPSRDFPDSLRNPLPRSLAANAERLRVGSVQGVGKRRFLVRNPRSGQRSGEAEDMPVFREGRSSLLRHSNRLSQSLDLRTTADSLILSRTSGGNESLLSPHFVDFLQSRGDHLAFEGGEQGLRTFVLKQW